MITQNNSIIKFLAAGVLFIAFTFSTTAQTTDVDQILGRANVLTGMDVEGLVNLDFGIVSPGVAKIVAVDGTVLPASSNTAGVTAGNFKITAGIGASVVLTWTTLPANLVGGSGSDNLQIDTYTAVYNSTATPSGGTVMANTTGGSSTIASFPATGEVYVYLGGKVTPLPAQPAGLYESPIILTATYN